VTLSDGYTSLPAGKIASVVTFLEMRKPPPLRPPQTPASLSVRRIENPSIDWYRKLYRAVGQEWLWFSRLRMKDQELAAIIQDPQVLIYAASDGNEDKGLLELDARVGSEIEISYFGLTSDLVGRGAGQYLMGCALKAAWDRNPDRVWVHTCTLDHARALPFYLKAGFVPYKRAIEIADDPRLTGETSRAVAPHVPLIDPR